MQGHKQSERRISKWSGLNWRSYSISETNSSKPHDDVGTKRCGLGYRVLKARRSGRDLEVWRKQPDGQSKPEGFRHASLNRVHKAIKWPGGDEEWGKMKKQMV